MLGQASFDLEKLKEELALFKKWPELLTASGFSVERIDETAFIAKANNALPAYNASKKYELILSALIHGNEVAGISVLNRILEDILNKKIKVEHSAGFFLHNEEAALQNKRFLERDLNRSFLNNDSTKLEEKLARRAEKIFPDFQFCVDIHQTNQKSETPFFIFFYTPKSMNWARFLDNKVPVIVSNKERHKDGSTLEFFCYKNDTIGVTIELGAVGFFEDQITYGKNLLKKAFNKKPLSFDSPGSFHNVFKVLESVYWTDERIILDPGFINFNFIKKNQKLGKIGNRDYISPYDGVILFPKYGEIAKNTKEVFTVAESVQSLKDL